MCGFFARFLIPGDAEPDSMPVDSNPPLEELEVPGRFSLAAAGVVSLPEICSMLLTMASHADF
jgi:hypothetical protein